MKRNFLFKLTAIILSMILLSSISACGSKNNGDNKVEMNGTHNLSAPMVDTEDYIVNNGKSDYKLLVSKENYSTAIVTCIEEFNSLFKKATGIILPVEYDTNVQYKEDSHYISLGETTLFNEAKIDWNREELKTDGCQIVTKGKNIYLFGASDYGVLNAVYDFFQICFNYEFYYRNCIEIDTNVSTLKLRNFNVKDIPDIAVRANINGFNAGKQFDTPRDTDLLAFGEDAYTDTKNRIARYRFNETKYAKFLPIYSEFNNTNSAANTIHNAFNYVTKEEAKPGWHSTSGEQLCYSASSHTDHFDEENFKALAEHCAKKIENSLKIFPRDAYPQFNLVSITQNDRLGFCKCATCEKWKQEDNGALSGGMIRLNNAVIKIVEEWMNQPENEPYKRDLRLVMFAYNNSEACPVKYNERTKQYEPANEEVVMAKNTGVYFAPQSAFEYVCSIYDKRNDKGRELCKQWLSLSDYTMLWLYGAFHTRPMYFMDSYNFFNKDAYQFFASCGFDYIYDENIDYSSDLTGFNALKTYIESKLMWDSTLDQDVLMKKFFNAMYKDAADTMYGLLLSYRNQFAYLAEHKGFFYGL